MRSVTLSFSNGVRPRRKSAAIESGRCSSRLSNCSTLKPVMAPCRPLRLAVPAIVWVSASTLSPEASTARASVTLALEPTQPEQLAETGFEVDVGELQLRFDVDAVRRLGERHQVPFSAPPNACASPIVTARPPVAQVGGDPGTGRAARSRP